jgi:hypothetical protein
VAGRSALWARVEGGRFDDGARKHEQEQDRMSKFEQLQTEIRSTRFLGEALSIIGHAPEVHPGGVAIKDYDGNAYPQQVEVVVRKTGSFLSDFGFAKGADGRLALVVDDLDRQYQLGPQWMGRLLQTYKEQETIATAKARGYVFRGREVTQTAAGPQIRLQFVAR